MDKIMIDTCIGRHSTEYFKALRNDNDSLAKYHYGVIIGFLAALLTTNNITAMEHMQLYARYLNLVE